MIARARSPAVALLAFLAVTGNVQAAQAERPVKLVLQITVDQLRGDLLPRYRSRIGKGGFGLFLDRGVHYANAHYMTANTITCSGHTVLATGANAAQHGIVGNYWYDRDANQLVYCAEDDRYAPVAEPAKHGTSPRRLTSSTIGDEIVLASRHRARAFAVAGKDRSAIMPGGYTGKAFWVSDLTGGVASSTYYYEALPPWVIAWNERKAFQGYRDTGWTLLHPLSTYAGTKQAANTFAHIKASNTQSFPHTLNLPDLDLVKALRFTPFLDELTADFARELIVQEKLGQNGATDYLSIGFSATDYIGHSYGLNSVESEDNLMRLDRTLAKLFATVDKAVGLENTMIVLSADHGVNDIPEERSQEGYDAGRLSGQSLRVSLNTALKQRFNVSEDLVAVVAPPGVYLDHSKIAAAHLDSAVVETALADAARGQPGVMYAFTRSDLVAGRIGNTRLLARVQRSFHPTRSGDVTIIEKPFWYFDNDADYWAAQHGSPHSYDTFVPILLFAPGIKPATVHEPAAPEQIVPTLAALLGIRPPSGCACEPPLPHVFTHAGKPWP